MIRCSLECIRKVCLLGNMCQIVENCEIVENMCEILGNCVFVAIETNVQISIFIVSFSFSALLRFGETYCS